MAQKPDHPPLPLVANYDSITPYELLTPSGIVSSPKKRDGKASYDWVVVVLFLMFLSGFILSGSILYRSLGGWTGLISADPILKDDHPLYLHSTVVTKTFLKLSGTTAGYDPTFMGGYAKSAVFPASSTFPELIVASTASIASAEVAYKFHVLICAVLAPLIVAWASAGLCKSWSVGFLSAMVWLVYIWTDFPIQYIGFGMLPYFFSIPLALATLRCCCDWLELGGFRRWFMMTTLLGLTILVHFTALMVIGPAAAGAWSFSRTKVRTAFAGLFSFVVAALANAFWWWPGIVLAETKGDSTFAFSHSQESVLSRLAKIPWSESPIESFLWLGLLAGMPILFQRRRIAAAGVSGFALGGFFWGYAAGVFSGLDFLQPGRHTYAFYLASSVFSGFLGAMLLGEIKRVNRYASIGLVIGVCLISLRIFGPSIDSGRKYWTVPQTAPLKSTIPPLYNAILSSLKPQVRPGDRVLYEEGGKGGDIFEGGRYSGVMARALGVEFLGGPYLHSALTTNLAQFGEGKLFGRGEWNLGWLEQLQDRYGISWIVAWSDRPRTMIDANPDKFQVVLSQGQLRVAKVLTGKQTGLPASPRLALSGQEHIDGEIKALPGRILLRIKPDSSGIGVDREVVLRYHWVPTLRVIGHSDVRVTQENAVEEPLPRFMKLLLGPSASGSVEIQLDPWGLESNGS